jgi:hypothetical protein
LLAEQATDWHNNFAFIDMKMPSAFCGKDNIHAITCELDVVKNPGSVPKLKVLRLNKKVMKKIILFF